LKGNQKINQVDTEAMKAFNLLSLARKY